MEIDYTASIVRLRRGYTSVTLTPCVDGEDITVRFPSENPVVVGQRFIVKVTKAQDEPPAATVEVEETVLPGPQSDGTTYE